MGQREHGNAGLRGQPGGLASSRVAGLSGPLGVLLGEGRLVDQQVGAVRHEPRHLARSGVAGHNDFATAARLAEHLDADPSGYLGAKAAATVPA